MTDLSHALRRLGMKTTDWRRLGPVTAKLTAEGMEMGGQAGRRRTEILSKMSSGVHLRPVADSS